MGLLTSFLNPNAMSNEEIVEITKFIVNEECKNDVRTITNGMFYHEEQRNLLKNGGRIKDYINFLEELNNHLDSDYEFLQARANHFANSYAYDKRILTRSHPIIKLYSLIIEMNVCCKNFSCCELEVMEVILNVDSESVAKDQILEIRKKSNFYNNETAKRLDKFMEIMDYPSRVLNL